MGIKGFFDNLPAIYAETDTETPRWAVFLEACHDSFGDNQFKTVELVNRVRQSAELKDALPDDIGDWTMPNYNVKVGKELGRRKNRRYVNGLMLKKCQEKRRACIWQIVHFDVTSPDFSFGGEDGEDESFSEPDKKGDITQDNL